ncbi:hypothetical protein Salat_0277000 [Sesamum alatum]|uniref:Uncharacterized protein n=1 Tax=Sesamum alatum TaxID=300844 RepID=A0AAE1YZX7_9LAMI|nr:hypothetical protein Salat_0277000 [Sesamum alatum]
MLHELGIEDPVPPWCNDRFSCLFSGDRKQEQARKALESALGKKKLEFKHSTRKSYYFRHSDRVSDSGKRGRDACCHSQHCVVYFATDADCIHLFAIKDCEIGYILQRKVLVHHMRKLLCMFLQKSKWLGNGEAIDLISGLSDQVLLLRILFLHPLDFPPQNTLAHTIKFLRVYSLTF